MPQNKDLKKLVRERMQQTGERYTEALANLTATPPLEPLPSPWFMSGQRPGSYEFGLLPADHADHADHPDHPDHPRARVVRLRRKGPDGAGFGTMMQSFTADNHRGHRIRLRAQLRGVGISGWAGLWMRVDDTTGKTAAFDNMQNRALTGTTDWQDATVVLEVATTAASIHFGLLLTGGGAVDVASLSFEEVDDNVPATNLPLADEPRGLDFAPL